MSWYATWTFTKITADDDISKIASPFGQTNSDPTTSLCAALLDHFLKNLNFPYVYVTKIPERHCLMVIHDSTYSDIKILAIHEDDIDQWNNYNSKCNFNTWFGNNRVFPACYSFIMNRDCKIWRPNHILETDIEDKYKIALTNENYHEKDERVVDEYMESLSHADLKSFIAETGVFRLPKIIHPKSSIDNKAFDCTDEDNKFLQFAGDSTVDLCDDVSLPVELTPYTGNLSIDCKRGSIHPIDILEFTIPNDLLQNKKYTFNQKSHWGVEANFTVEISFNEHILQTELIVDFDPSQSATFMLCVGDYSYDVQKINEHVGSARLVVKTIIIHSYNAYGLIIRIISG